MAKAHTVRCIPRGKAYAYSKGRGWSNKAPAKTLCGRVVGHGDMDGAHFTMIEVRGKRYGALSAHVTRSGR